MVEADAQDDTQSQSAISRMRCDGIQFIGFKAIQDPNLPTKLFLLNPLAAPPNPLSVRFPGEFGGDQEIQCAMTGRWIDSEAGDGPFFHFHTAAGGAEDPLDE